jgi:hypothetical protein
MKKLLTIGLIASAILTSNLSANSYEAAKNYYEKKGMDFDSLVKNDEDREKEFNKISVKVGEFYDKAGFAVSYEKVINTNFSELPVLTILETEAGFNKSELSGKFASIGASNYAYPFFWDAYLPKNFENLNLAKTLSVVVKTELTTFSYEDRKTLKDTRTIDALYGVGFNWVEPISFSNIELTFAKGLLSEVDSEIELKYSTDKFSLSGKRTNVDGESYDSINVAYNYKF